MNAENAGNAGTSESRSEHNSQGQDPALSPYAGTGHPPHAVTGKPPYVGTSQPPFAGTDQPAYTRTGQPNWQEAPVSNAPKSGGTLGLVVSIVALAVWVIVGWFRTILLYLLDEVAAIALANSALTILIVLLAVVSLILSAIGLKREAGRVKSAIGLGISIAILVAVVGGWLGSALISLVASGL